MKRLLSIALLAFAVSLNAAVNTGNAPVTLSGEGLTITGASVVTNATGISGTDGLGDFGCVPFSLDTSVHYSGSWLTMPYLFNGTTWDRTRGTNGVTAVQLAGTNHLVYVKPAAGETFPISGEVSASLTWDNGNKVAVGPSAAASLTPSTTLTNALTALGFGVYQTSLPTKTDGQISPLQTDASGNLKVSVVNETLGDVYTDPVYSAITDGTNIAAVTASHALMVEQGAMDYTTDSVTVYFGNTNAYYTPSNPLVVKAVESTNSSAGFSKTVSVTPCQGADGTIAAFTANDVATYPFEIDCARANGKGVYLNNIVATVGIDCSTTPPAFELYLCDSRPTLAAPEEPWDMADDQLSKVVGGPYSIPTTYWAVQGTLNGIMQTNTCSTLILPASDSTKLYGVLKAKNTWTPGATNDLVLKFKFMQD